MRAAVVFFAVKNRDEVLSIARALAKGMESQGHQIDVVDGMRDVNTKLTLHSYIAVGTEAVSLFGGKIPEKVAFFLASAGHIVGKRSFAFVRKTPFGANGALLRLMKAMEREGMYLKYSEIIRTAEAGEEIGSRLHMS
jgi:menaquinone-dependent protoporphyrinogen IX oxidase